MGKIIAAIRGWEGKRFSVSVLIDRTYVSLESRRCDVDNLFFEYYTDLKVLSPKDFYIEDHYPDWAFVLTLVRDESFIILHRNNNENELILCDNNLYVSIVLSNTECVQLKSSMDEAISKVRNKRIEQGVERVLISEIGGNEAAGIKHVFSFCDH